MSWSIGVDVGGTFTDFHAHDEATGRSVLAKRPSTRDNPGIAVLEGLDDLARQGVPMPGVTRLAHGTTVATNALIQRTGGRVALITTAGFRDLLEIGRQIRPHMYDLYLDYPPAVVPRERRLEIEERITANGRVIRELSDENIARVVDEVKAIAPDACAICLLFAFQNPEHEQRIAAAIAAELPGMALSLSSEVQAEFREYERFSTTAINAYLQPVMSEYMERLESGMHQRIPQARIGINQSSGGLMSPARTRGFPVRTALSGPAAGVVGAIAAGREVGRRDLITLDMGGTSADVALIRDLEADISHERDVAGFPIRLPTIDVHTVGAGGGSIAWFDRDELLKVGPQSAGADPGPACYQRGGTLPTVSDANLVLGRLSNRGLLGGEMALDASLSEAAIRPVADTLGHSIERTAAGILGIVAANMVRAIRTISVERGHDPRSCALVAFGGAGPLHARDVAVALGIRELMVPKAPGIVCAQGLIIADLKEDFVLGARVPIRRESSEAITKAVNQLSERAAQWFESEAVESPAREVELNFDCRYIGQNFELRIPVTAGAPDVLLTLPGVEDLEQRFFEVHDQAYGFHNPDDPLEIVNVRLTAYGRVAQPEREEGMTDSGPPEPGDWREVWFDDDRPVHTPVYSRKALHIGQVFQGPAVIDQLDATTLVYPGDRVRVSTGANLLIEIDPEGSA